MSGIEFHESFEQYDNVEEQTLIKYNEIKRKKTALEEILEAYELAMNGELTVKEFNEQIKEIEENSPL